MANYALIKPVNSIETIINIIVASPEVAATYLVANSGEFDYVLDTSLYSPIPEIGYSYDSGEDTFSPPPEDFEAELETALLEVLGALETAQAAYAAASGGEQSTAVGNVLSEISEDPNYELMVTIVTSIIG